MTAREKVDPEKHNPEQVTMQMDDLRPFSGNPRKMSEKGINKLRESIRRFGFTSPVVVQRRTNVIIAGHQRYRAAKLEGITEVPAILVDLDDDEAIALNIADNRLSEEAEWDVEKLSELLGEMSSELTKVTGFDDGELSKLLGLDPPAKKDEKWVDRYEIVVECESEEEQEELYQRFTEEGLKCRVLSL